MQQVPIIPHLLMIIILTADGVGEWATTTIGIGKDNNLKLIQEIIYPDSLGLIYSAFTFIVDLK